MADVSKIDINGTIYNVKDDIARNMSSALNIKEFYTSNLNNDETILENKLFILSNDDYEPIKDIGLGYFIDDNDGLSQILGDRKNIYLSSNTVSSLSFQTLTGGLEKLLQNGEAYYYINGVFGFGRGYYSQNIKYQSRLPIPNKCSSKNITCGSLLWVRKIVYPASDLLDTVIDFNSISISDSSFSSYKLSRGYAGKSDGEFIKFLILNGEIFGSLNGDSQNADDYYPIVDSDGNITLIVADVVEDTTFIHNGEFYAGNCTSPGIYTFMTTGRPVGSVDGENYILYVDKNGAQRCMSILNHKNEYYRANASSDWIKIENSLYNGEFYSGDCTKPGIYTFMTSGRPPGSVTGEDYVLYVDKNGAQRCMSILNPDNEYYRANASSDWIKNISVGKNTGGTGEIFNDYTDNYAHSDHGHAEGQKCRAESYNAHAEGYSTKAGWDAHSEGGETTASGKRSHAEGDGTIASGEASHAEGSSGSAGGRASHAEGSFATASGDISHAEGNSTIASGYASHAEGSSTTALGHSSHAEGENTKAEKNYSHAEGEDTTASGHSSHAEGDGTTASGAASHAEGYNTKAQRNYSHAEGVFNKPNANQMHAIGIGSSDTNRKNAVEVDYNGNVYIKGMGNYDGTNYGYTDVKSLQEVMEENERVIAISLNDLNSRIGEIQTILESI